MFTPALVYATMSLCWHDEPESRPSMGSLCLFFRNRVNPDTNDPTAFINVYSNSAPHISSDYVDLFSQAQQVEAALVAVGNAADDTSNPRTARSSCNSLVDGQPRASIASLGLTSEDSADETPLSLATHTSQTTIDGWRRTSSSSASLSLNWSPRTSENSNQSTSVQSGATSAADETAISQDLPENARVYSV